MKVTLVAMVPSTEHSISCARIVYDKTCFCSKDVDMSLLLQEGDEYLFNVRGFEYLFKADFRRCEKGKEIPEIHGKIIFDLRTAFFSHDSFEGAGWHVWRVE